MKLVTPKEVEKFIEKTANKYFTKPIEIAGNTCIETRKDIYIYNFDKVAPTGIYLILKSDIEKYQRKIKGMRKSRIKEVAEPPLYLLEMLPSEILHHINRLEDILQLERHKFMLDEHTALTQTELANYALLNHCETDEERVELAKELNKYVEGSELLIGRTSQALDLVNRTTSRRMKTNKNNELFISNKKVMLCQPIVKADKYKLTAFTGKLNRYVLSHVDGSQVSRNKDEYIVKFHIKEWLKDIRIEDTPENRTLQRKYIYEQLDILATTAFKTKVKGKPVSFPYLGTTERGSETIKVHIYGEAKLYFLASTMCFNYVIPRILFSIDNKKFPLVMNVYDKLFYQSQMNAGDANSNTLSYEKLVDHLLIDVDNIEPKYHNRRVSEPIEKSLNLLHELGILQWNYCHAKGEPLTDDEQAARTNKKGEARALPYKIAKGCYIQWEWNNQNIVNYFSEYKVKRDNHKAIKAAIAEQNKKAKENSDKRIQKKFEDRAAEKLAQRYVDDNPKLTMI